MNLHVFRKKGRNADAISMLTCYDYSAARILREAPVEAFLVGDSLAMTIYGHPTTLPATVDMMARHTEAVRRGLGADRALVVDLPFLAHRGSLDRVMEAVRTLMVAGADAVKVEGIAGHDETLRHIVQSGVPVMGHLGLMPQSVHLHGGYRVQGKTAEAARSVVEQAHQVQGCGCFALVLECVPAELAAQITRELDIPVIGIGAGPEVDGQVLVMQDALGMNLDFSPRFVRRFADTGKSWQQAAREFSDAVRQGRFPDETESF